MGNASDSSGSDAMLGRLGKVAAAFNSSYKPARPEYGVYPLKDGKLDESRASKHYVYSAYVAKHSKDSALLISAEVKGRRVVVERKAPIISELEKRGAKIQEVANYVSMLRMAASGRVDAAVGIEGTLDAIIDRHADLAALIQKVETPIQKKFGYMMFSKKFYVDHGLLVECFWTASAKLRETEWFKTRRATYK